MSTSIPARHPDHPGPVPAAIALAAAALRIGKPDAGQWTRLGDQLSIGDDPMDSLVASAPPGGLKKLRTEFERALAEGSHPSPMRRNRCRTSSHRLKHHRIGLIRRR